MPRKSELIERFVVFAHIDPSLRDESARLSMGILNVRDDGADLVEQMRDCGIEVNTPEQALAACLMLSILLCRNTEPFFQAAARLGVSDVGADPNEPDYMAGLNDLITDDEPPPEGKISTATAMKIMQQIVPQCTLVPLFGGLPAGDLIRPD